MLSVPENKWDYEMLPRRFERANLLIFRAPDRISGKVFRNRRLNSLESMAIPVLVISSQLKVIWTWSSLVIRYILATKFPASATGPFNIGKSRSVASQTESGFAFKVNIWLGTFDKNSKEPSVPAWTMLWTPWWRFTLRESWDLSSATYSTKAICTVRSVSIGETLIRVFQAST